MKSCAVVLVALAGLCIGVAGAAVTLGAALTSSDQSWVIYGQLIFAAGMVTVLAAGAAGHG